MSDNYLIDDINATLTKLLSQRMQEIGRAADMLWIGFGDDIIYVNLKGMSVVKSEYALHIQCNWEITDGNEVILDQGDFNIPEDETPLELFDVEQFGNSKFDKMSVEFNTTIKANPTYVVSFDAYITGGFRLELSNNFMMRVYPSSPPEGESWRFLMPGSDEEHLVVFED